VLVGNDERGGRQKFPGTEVLIAAVVDLVKTHCLNASKMITEALNILKNVVLWVLKVDLE
jgi:hypothetical protein